MIFVYYFEIEFICYVSAFSEPIEREKLYMFKRTSCCYKK